MTEVAEPLRRPRLGPSRTDVLHHLQQAGVPLSIALVAEAVDLHPNTARFHLDALVEDGLASREPEKRDRPGRPKMLYRADPEPDDEVTYVDLAGALIRHLSHLTGEPSEQVEEAGRLWGVELAGAHPDQAPLDRVVSTLDSLGYHPALVGSPVEAVTMTPCPFQALTGQDRDTDELPSICRLHLGLIRGLMADDPHYEVDSLTAWATPTTCIARLLPRHG